MKTNIKGETTSSLKPVLEIVTEIIEHPDTTKAYRDKIGEIHGASQCVVKVDSIDLQAGYKKLMLEPDKTTISYRDDSEAVRYRTLTHKLVGKAISFGLYCSRKGKMELYRFVDSEIDCVKLADIKLSRNIVDPMYSLVSEDKLYVIYNVPSPKALKSTTRTRLPIVDVDGALASGAPGIVCFDLKNKDQERLLVPFEPMDNYSCGLYCNTESSEPKLVVANIYDIEPADERPSFRALINGLLDSKGDSMPAAFPLGVSSVSFINGTEISQSPFDGDPANGIRSIILKDSNENAVNVFSLKDER